MGNGNYGVGNRKYSKLLHDMSTWPQAWSWGLLLYSWIFLLVEGQDEEDTTTVATVASYTNTEYDMLKALQYSIARREPAFLKDLLHELLVVQGWDTRKLETGQVKDNAFKFPGYTAIHYVCLTNQHKTQEDKAEHMKLLLNAGLNKDISTGDGSGIRPVHVCAAMVSLRHSRC